MAWIIYPLILLPPSLSHGLGWLVDATGCAADDMAAAVSPSRPSSTSHDARDNSLDGMVY